MEDTNCCTKPDGDRDSHHWRRSAFEQHRDGYTKEGKDSTYGEVNPTSDYHKCEA